MSSPSVFFLPPQAIRDGCITITDADVIRQMRKVLRLAVGDAFVALDGARHEYQCVIDAFDRGEIRAHVQSVVNNTRETPIAIYCYPSLIKRERFAFLLEKCTELGAASYTPIAAHRSPYTQVTPHLQKRWEHIIREAAEVARRGIVPALHPVQHIADVVAHVSAHARCFVLATHQKISPSLSKGLGVVSAHELPGLLHGAESVHLFIGPEGDYTEEEYALFAEKGVIPFTLGPRIVRSETAAIASVALFASFL